VVVLFKSIGFSLEQAVAIATMLTEAADKIVTTVISILIIKSMSDRYLIKFKYTDNGKGLEKKYLLNPKKILEVHETTRKNGHGLGMWILNNTVNISGGEILSIKGEEGFSIEFTLGRRIK